MMITKTKLLAYVLLFSLALIGVRMLWGSWLHPTSHPQIERGVLDLRSWSPDDRPMSLNGQWRFYANPTLQTGEFAADSFPKEPDAYLKVPGEWNQASSPLGRSMAGYGAYRLTILVDPSYEGLFGLRIQKAAGASKLYVNGLRVGGSGEPTATETGFEPGFNNYTAGFSQNRGVIDIVVEVANYRNPFHGGLYDSVKFGSYEAIERGARFNQTVQLIIAVVLALHAVYGVLLLFLRTGQRSLIVSFIGILLCATLMVLTDDDRLLRVPILLEDGWYSRIARLSYLGVAPFSLSFALGMLYKDGNWKRVFYGTCIPAYAVSVLLLCTDHTAAAPGTKLYNLLIMLITFAMILFVTARAILAGERGAIYLLLCEVAMVFSTLGGLAKGLQIFDAGFYPIDLFVAVLLLASFWFSRFYRVREQAVELAKELMEEDKRKDDFLAGASHELRTPLHSMMNIAQTVLDTEGLTMQRPNAERMELLVTVGRRMSLLLNDLLDMTMLKERRIRLRPEPVRLQSVVSGVAGMLDFMAKSKSLRFENRVAADFPEVRADEGRLVQILFNLLHNAVKFTPAGTISIRADATGERAIVRVEDTGPGMDEETVRKAFDPYAQGDANPADGIGLGLSIAKQLIELQGGEIGVISAPGQGSTFWFALPLADPSGTAALADDGQADPERPATDRLGIPDGRSRTDAMPAANGDQSPAILVVEDDPVNLKVLSELLLSDGCYVGTATSGTEALTLLNMREWDLVVTDVMMPGMSGYELTSAIRERFSLSELPVLLLTARARQEDLLAGFRAGANDYAAKPLVAHEILARVRALAGLKHAVKSQLRMEAAWLQAQIKPHFLFNALNAIGTLGEIDIGRMREMLDNLGQYLRASYDFSNSERFILLSRELDLIRAYLSIETERFPDRIRVRWEIDAAADDLLLPPLSIQPLVENAVLHGLMPTVRGGEIVIRIVRRTDGTEVTVTDDGVGMSEDKAVRLLQGEPAPGQGIGLRNADRRLKQIYGSGLTIHSAPGRGTSVGFLIGGTAKKRAAHELAQEDLVFSK